VNFVIRMTLRELRASWRRLVFFFICVALGVGAIVALRSIIQTVRDGMVREARAMMAADVTISTSRPWTPEVRAMIDRRLAEAPVLDRTEAVEIATMVRAAGEGTVARMVDSSRGAFATRTSCCAMPASSPVLNCWRNSVSSRATPSSLTGDRSRSAASC
jgi:hypothetical protein